MATKDKDPAVPPPAEVKRHAFGQVADALEPLDRYDRLKIAASTPPASSFEGRVQRWRDAKDDDEFEVVWSGKDSLSNMGHDVAESEDWSPDLEPRTDELVGRRR